MLARRLSWLPFYVDTATEVIQSWWRFFSKTKFLTYFDNKYFIYYLIGTCVPLASVHELEQVWVCLVVSLYISRLPWVWGFPWGFQWGFLWVWDGYGDLNAIPRQP